MSWDIDSASLDIDSLVAGGPPSQQLGTLDSRGDGIATAGRALCIRGLQMEFVLRYYRVKSLHLEYMQTGHAKSQHKDLAVGRR